MYIIKRKRINKLLDFQSILPDVIKELNIEKELFIERLSAEWLNIVTSTLAVHSQPNRIFKKTLFIMVDHPVFSNELIMMKEIIIEKINQIAPGTGVKNIKCEIKKTKNIYTH